MRKIPLFGGHSGPEIAITDSAYYADYDSVIPQVEFEGELVDIIDAATRILDAEIPVLSQQRLLESLVIWSTEMPGFLKWFEQLFIGKQTRNELEVLHRTNISFRVLANSYSPNKFIQDSAVTLSNNVNTYYGLLRDKAINDESDIIVDTHELSLRIPPGYTAGEVIDVIDELAGAVGVYEAHGSTFLCSNELIAEYLSTAGHHETDSRFHGMKVLHSKKIRNRVTGHSLQDLTRKVRRAGIEELE